MGKYVVKVYYIRGFFSSVAFDQSMLFLLIYFWGDHASNQSRANQQIAAADGGEWPIS